MSNMSAVINFIRRYKDDRGAMAALRCLLNPEQRFRAWQLIAGINGIGNTAIETVAGLYALHPEEKVDEDYHFGSACKQLAFDRKKQQVDDESPFDKRFRRLLACDSREELRAHLKDIVRGMKSSGIPVNYASLYDDICWWGDRVRERWAIQYWQKPFKKEDLEDVSE